MFDRYPGGGEMHVNNEAQVSIANLFRVLWHRRLVLLAFLLVGMSSGFLYLMTAVPSYQVRARVMVLKQRPPLEH